MLAGVITAAEWMASAPEAAAGPQPTTVVAEDLVAAVQRRRDGVPVHRLRYESPVEIALAIVNALTIGKVGLMTLVYMVKRVSGLDLEIRTHRVELEERHLEAVARVAELKKAGPPGYGRIPDLPLNALNALDAATIPATSSRLEPAAIVLEDDPATETDVVVADSLP
jgi:hypothetical protein